MYALLLTLLLDASFKAFDAKPQPAMEVHDTICEQSSAPVILVADGGSDWAAEASDRLVRELKAELGSFRLLEVGRFDAEPTLQSGTAVNGLNHDFVLVRPRTPMREVMEAGFIRLMDATSPRTMVVIAHAQFNSTSVSTNDLIDLARRSNTKVYTIHLRSRRANSAFRSLGQSLRNRMSRLSESLGHAESGFSVRDTAQLLQAMADATGGTACTTSGEQREVDCARLVAAEIVGPSR